MTGPAISSSRREWLTACLAAIPCVPPLHEQLAFRDLPAAAAAIAGGLGLTERDWSGVLETERRKLPQRIEEGSAEHITYYVLQSREFTTRPSIDPVRLAASRPATLPPEAAARFKEFLSVTAPTSERQEIILRLWHTLESRWSPEKCFLHTMAFLAAKGSSDRETLGDLYYRRGLSTDTIPEQTLVIERGLASIRQELNSAPMLLVGPGLDLTRREGFHDDLPLKSYQADWLASRGAVDCIDVRPEVVEFLNGGAPRCAFVGDITQTILRRRHYGAAFATNVLLYFNDRSLFLALAVIAAALHPGGFLVHNDQRFAAKVFGEALGLPVTRFDPVSLGRRGPVELMDRVVIHRRTVAPGDSK